MKPIIILVSFLLLCTTGVQAQAFCTTAVDLSCGQTIRSNNFSTRNQLTYSSYGSCLSDAEEQSNPFTAGEKIYQITATGTLTIQLTTSSIGGDLDLFVFDDCMGGHCVAKSLNSGRSVEQVTLHNASGTYYVVVDGYRENQTNQFELTLNCSERSDCAPSLCESAIPIACGQELMSDNLNSGNQLGKMCNYANCYGGAKDFSGNDRVFRLEVPQGIPRLSILLSDYTGDLDLFVFRDACDLSQCVGGSVSTNSLGVEGLNINNPYGTIYIVVDGANATQKSPFRLSIMCNGVDNTSCDDISSVNCGDRIIGDNRSGTNSFTTADNYRSCFNENSNFNGYDRVYKLVLEEQKERVNIRLSNLSTDLDLFILKNSCTGNSCVDASFLPNREEELITLENAQGTYFLVVDSQDSSTSEFVLNIDCEDAEEEGNDCEEEPTDCAAVSFLYVGENGLLNYAFTADDQLPIGKWLATGSIFGAVEMEIGNGKYLNYTFPRIGVYTLIYRYETIEGCMGECHKTIDITDPFECSEVSYGFNKQTNSYELTIPNVNPENVKAWHDISTTTAIGNTVTVDIPISDTPCEMHSYSVTFFDPVANYYRVCGMNLYLCDPYACEMLEKSYDEDSNMWMLNLPSIEDIHIMGWQNDGNLAVLTDAGEKQISIPNPEVDDCHNISVSFFDPNCNCYNLCAAEVCGMPGVCASIENEILQCIDDSNYTYQLTLNNTSGREGLSAHFAIIAPAGIAFEDCSNINTIQNLSTGEQTISLQLSACSMVLSAGTEVQIKTTLDNGQEGSGWQCFLGAKSLIIPECDDCRGIEQDIFCPDFYAPVCGCDGITYTNACVAVRAGVMAWESGECSTLEGCNGASNLVQNSTFDGGNNSFGSDLEEDCNCALGTYCITDNTTEKCANWPTTAADGNFLLIEGALNQNTVVWEQGIAVQQGEQYTFALDLYPMLSEADIPMLQLSINGETSTITIENADEVQKIEQEWIATETTTIRLQILQIASTSSHVYGLDNIKFEHCPSSANFFIEGESNIDNSALKLSNHPNPFVQNTTITFSVPSPQEATISIYDVHGALIFQQTDWWQAGKQQLQLQANDLEGNGIYFYEIKTALFTATKSMILLQL